MASLGIFFCVVLVSVANLQPPHRMLVSSFSLPPPSPSLSLSCSLPFSVHPALLSSRSGSLPWRNEVHQTYRVSSRIFSNTDNDAFIKASSGDDQDPYSKYTHQIAIPLDNASELHSALNKIQSSLVGHCPRLIRACVMPVLLRLPLLYVDAGSMPNVNIFGGEDASDGVFTELLEKVVHRSIRTVVYGDGDGGNHTLSVAAEPILLPFRTLELQGSDNSVLFAVGANTNDQTSNGEATKKKERYGIENDDDDGVYILDDWDTSSSPTASASAEGTRKPSGWEILEKLVHTIQNDLQTNYGLDTCWPLDEPQGEEIQRKWRPRVPCVRLPSDFYQDVQADFEKRNKEKDGDDPPSYVDYGFDGISPLFWYDEWGQPQDENDFILPPPGIRMRSVAVYRRVVPGGGEADSSFYVPTSSSFDSRPYRKKESTSDRSMELPAGDTKLQSRERREAGKAMDRMGAMEQREEREWEEGKARWMEELGNPRNSPTVDEKSFDEFDVGMEIGEVKAEEDSAYSDLNESSSIIAQSSVEQNKKQSLPNDDEPIGIASVEREQLQRASTPEAIKPRRDLPSIEDNPIFQRLWKGEPQVTSEGQAITLALNENPPDSPLPPYPSDGHFLGPWRVVSSPLGTEDRTSILEDKESKASDNFILRVDGQVMGGPILDTQYKQKAAGGEWNMFQAVRRKETAGNKNSDSVSPPVEKQTRLRIRLLIPPQKERCLVMEGEVTRLVMPGGAGDDSSDGWKRASGGILDGMLKNINNGDDREEFNQFETDGNDGEEGLLYCAGEAWTEDADSRGTNRKKLGPFSLMKLKNINRDDLIYTVDLSRARQAEEENDNGEVFQ